MGKGKPKLVHIPKGNEPRLGVNPSSQLFVYRLKTIDSEGPWGWNHLRHNWKEIVSKLDDYQTRAWDEILKDCGGRKAGTNHHPISVQELNKCAIKRIAALGMDEENVFSLRLSGRERVYGIRRGIYFDMLWFDPTHGDNEECVCRSRKD
ncbi:MAG: hypothetical protein EBS53_10540 [Bacteroidetes bacterium]|nr:hypothetical protein [Bacteroidota bacterium]